MWWSCCGNPCYADEGLKRSRSHNGVAAGDLSKSFSRFLLLLFTSSSPRCSAQSGWEMLRKSLMRCLFIPSAQVMKERSPPLDIWWPVRNSHNLFSQMPNSKGRVRLPEGKLINISIYLHPSLCHVAHCRPGLASRQTIRLWLITRLKQDFSWNCYYFASCSHLWSRSYTYSALDDASGETFLIMLHLCLPFQVKWFKIWKSVWNFHCSPKEDIFGRKVLATD